MRKYLHLLFLGVAAVFIIAATAPSYLTARDLFVRNSDNTVGIKVTKGASYTANAAEFYVGSQLRTAIPAVGLVRASGATARIESGLATCGVNGGLTNSFANAFSAAPLVITTLRNNVGPTNNVLTVTTTNFTYTSGSQTSVVQWLAIGAP
jgi:hypothetical protein